MLIIIIVSVLLAFLFALLIIPIEFIVETERDIYKIHNRLLFSIQYVPGTEPGMIRVRILFIWFKLRLMKWLTRSSKKTKEKPKPEKVEKSTKSKKRKPVFGLIRRLLGTIKVKYLHAHVDTGDFPLNARLIPIAQVFSGHNRNININFENDNRLDLCIQHRPINALIAVLKYYV